MAHFMPWYQTPPTSQGWGWHWTMNHFHPESSTSPRQEAASHYHPLIGLYDSSDEDVLACQVQLMKLAGIDGAIIDWYGTDDCLDYKINHQNTQSVMEYLTKAHLKFAIMYEDRTVPKLIENGIIQEQDAVSHGITMMHWLQDHWFANPDYLKIDSHPILLVFGPQYYKDDDWEKMLAPLTPQPLLFTLQQPRGPAYGAFSWPQPAGGTKKSWQNLQTYYASLTNSKGSIPAAYPRFHDIYWEAGVQPSWGHIDDGGGLTYKQTLERALDSKSPVVQLVTWNDWGEGTQIEPSLEFGYRDLELTQHIRRTRIQPLFPYRARDLRLPIRLYELRKKLHGSNAAQSKLDRISQLLFDGNVKEARKLLDRMDKDTAETI